MPCLEISMPEVSDEIRETLAERLTEAFAEATPFPAEIFGIRFHEYEYPHVASNGRLCSESDKRPYLHMLLYCPRINRETKQKVVESFTATFTDVLNHPAWKPVIHICEHPYDNVGVGGKLLSDAYPELAERKFYFDLSEE